MNLPLVESGDVSRSEVLKLRRQVVDIQAQITNRRNKYLHDCQTDLVTQEELAGILQIVTPDAIAKAASVKQGRHRIGHALDQA